MTTPLITVLLPCYNAMPYLREALESIIDQTYTNLEILCINDGSTDETGKVLEEYAASDKRITVIHNETNIKLIRSLNKGIALANGEYIARMDSDDKSTPDRIEKELEFMLQNPGVDIVGCTCFIMNDTGAVIAKKTMSQHNELPVLFASFFYVPIGHPELLIKTSVLKDNLYLNEEHVLHTEDYELWTRLLRKGYHLRNIDNPLHYFRLNPKSVSNKYTEIQDNNFVECASRHWIAVFDRTIETDVMRVIVNRLKVLTQPHELKKGMQEMRWLKKHFTEKYKAQLQKDDKKEIYLIYKSHIFDMCVQGIKKTKIISKVYILIILVKNFDMFFNRRIWKYIAHKFNYIQL